MPACCHVVAVKSQALLLSVCRQHVANLTLRLITLKQTLLSVLCLNAVDMWQLDLRTDCRKQTESI